MKLIEVKCWLGATELVKVKVGFKHWSMWL